jgi:lactocepin
MVTDADGNQTVDDQAIAFSSDKNALYNDISMQYYLLRNISNVQVDILDGQGNKVTTLSSSTNQTKTYYDAHSQQYIYYNAPAWDGTYYDQRDGNIKTADDGSYTYRISGVPEGGDKRQVFDVPFKLDSKAPTVRHVALSAKTENGKTQYYLTAEAKDDLSGLDATKSVKTAINEVTNLDATFTDAGTTADGYTKIETPLSDEQAQALGNGDNSAELYLTDNASNATDQDASVQKPGSTSFDLIVNGGGIPDKISSTTTGYEANTQGGGTYTFSGTYPAAVDGTYTDAQGKKHDLNTTYDAATNSFTASMAVTNADYAAQVDLYADKAHTQLLKHFDTKVRLTAPTFTDLKFNNGSDQTSEATIKVTGTVSADTKTVNVGDTVAALDAQHHFSVDVPVNYGGNTIKVTATDEDGNTTTEQKTITSSYDPDVLKNAVTFDQGVTFGANEFNATSAKFYDPKTGIATITGKVKHPTTTLQVDGKQIPIKDDLTFSFTLDLGTLGQKPFGVVVGDTTQNKTFQEALTFILDAVAPTLSLDSSTDAPVYTNDPNFQITGTATDNAQYLSLAINGSHVASQYADININSGKPGHMAIDQPVKLLEGKNVLTVAVTDSENNTTTKKITVYYEPKKTLAAPTVTPSTTEPAKTVTLTANAAATGETVQYSADGGKTYQDVPAAGVTVTANGTFKFKSTDLYGNESPAVDYVVTNIKTDDPAQLQAAKQALTNLIASAKTLSASGKYDDATTTALAAATQKAQTTLDQTDASVDSLTGANRDLQTAINQLAAKLPADKKTSLLNQLQSVKAALGTDLGNQTDPSTGKTFMAALDDLVAQAQAGTQTADQLQASLAKVLDAVLAKLAEGIKAATPAEVGNAKDAATGKTWYADIADTLTSGQASADASDKLAHLQALQSLKTKVAAAVEAAKTAGKGDDTSGTSDKGGGQGTPAPAPGDTGKDKGDEGSQPSSGGNIPTKPATTTSTSTDDTTDRNGQHTSGKGALPKTAETTERPAFGFLGVIVVSLMGVLGLKRKQREE